MRVIHMIKATGLAGAERHLLDLLPGLRALGCDARLFHLSDPRKPSREFTEQARARGVPVSRLSIRRHLDPRLWFRLQTRLRDVRPDIVHTHMIHGDVYGITAARLAKVPVIISTRHNSDSFRHREPVRMLNRWLWSRIDLGIAVSQAMECFSREVEGGSAPMRVIPHGVAKAPQAKEGGAATFLDSPPRPGPVVGMVCRLTRQKGVRFGIEAFAKVAGRFPGATLLIAGEGPERRALEAWSHELGVGERVRFLGWQDNREALLAQLDVLMAPSLWEGFGLVVLEAMARGVAVLASRVGAHPELVVEGETGLLAAPGNVGELTAGLERMLADSPFRKRLGAGARNRAQRHFSLSSMIETTLRAYVETLERVRFEHGC